MNKGEKIMESTKVNLADSQTGSMGEKFLAQGEEISMRYWNEGPVTGEFSVREYETVGYVIEGKAELEFEDKKVSLEQGDSWVVPKNSKHRYIVLEKFRAVEAITSTH